MTGAAAEDPQLLRAARSGDEAALERLLRSLLPQVHAVCRRLCRDPQDAQDAAQEALVAVARGLPGFDGRSRLSTWVYRITTNACHDELRRRRRRPEPAAADDVAAGFGDRGAPTRSGPAVDPEAEVLRGEERRRLAAALDELPEEFRVAVVLRDVADLEYSAIAEITAVPVGTVRSRIARGRSRLADLLAPAGTDSTPTPSHTPETT